MSNTARSRTLRRAAVILAAKGGTLAEITAGDVLELLDAEASTHAGRGEVGAAVFYQKLHQLGILEARHAPATLRELRVRGPAQRPRNWSTATRSPAVPSATCSWTTCANASPPSTTPA